MKNNTMVFDSRLNREYYILSEDNNTVYFYSYTWIDFFHVYPSYYLAVPTALISSIVLNPN